MLYWELQNRTAVWLTLEPNGTDDKSLISIGMLQKMTEVKRVTGQALGVEFQLNAAERRALGLFLDRVRSDNPGRFPQ